MKTPIILALALVLPLSLQAMQKAKPAAAEKVQDHTVNRQALTAIVWGKIEELKKYLGNPKFDINYIYPDNSMTLLTDLCAQQSANALVALRAVLEHYASNPGKLNPSISARPDCCPALHLAAWTRNHDALRELLAYKDKINLDIDYNRDTQQKRTALSFAVGDGNIREALLLLQAGANPNIPNQFSVYPIHETLKGAATWEGDTVVQCVELELMMALADCGVDLNSLYLAQGKTPMQYALEMLEENGYIGKERIVCLLAIGATITPDQATIFATLEGWGKVPLNSSIGGKVQDEIWLEFILRSKILNQTHLSMNMLGGPEKKCPSLNAQDIILGMTALHWAAARGDLEFAQQLAELGADASITDNWGNTPLHIAVRNGHTHLIPFLKGLYIRAMIMRNKFGRNPVDIAERANKSVAILEALASR